ncbi:Hypothetical protein SCF082_LOCUS13399 [Durusdinium trenchii]|uniref:SAP domain-containing protein n=1 Tax=Durusdinium trenchii TaxID=1381693 RepID=A0ABP0JS61_9DINO
MVRTYLKLNSFTIGDYKRTKEANPGTGVWLSLGDTEQHFKVLSGKQLIVYEWSNLIDSRQGHYCRGKVEIPFDTIVQINLVKYTDVTSQLLLELKRAPVVSQGDQFWDSEKRKRGGCAWTKGSTDRLLLEAAAKFRFHSALIGNARAKVLRELTPLFNERSFNVSLDENFVLEVFPPLEDQLFDYVAAMSRQRQTMGPRTPRGTSGHSGSSSSSTTPLSSGHAPSASGSGRKRNRHVVQTGADKGYDGTGGKQQRVHMGTAGAHGSSESDEGVGNRDAARFLVREQSGGRTELARGIDNGNNVSNRDSPTASMLSPTQFGGDFGGRASPLQMPFLKEIGSPVQFDLVQHHMQQQQQHHHHLAAPAVGPDGGHVPEQRHMHDHDGRGQPSVGQKKRLQGDFDGDHASGDGNPAHHQSENDPDAGNQERGGRQPSALPATMHDVFSPFDARVMSQSSSRFAGGQQREAHPHDDGIVRGPSAGRHRGRGPHAAGYSENSFGQQHIGDMGLLGARVPAGQHADQFRLSPHDLHQQMHRGGQHPQQHVPPHLRVHGRRDGDLGVAGGDSTEQGVSLIGLTHNDAQRKLENMSVLRLRTQLKLRNLRKSGRKSDLVARLLEHECSMGNVQRPPTTMMDLGGMLQQGRIPYSPIIGNFAVAGHIGRHSTAAAVPARGASLFPGATGSGVGTSSSNFGTAGSAGPREDDLAAGYPPSALAPPRLPRPHAASDDVASESLLTFKMPRSIFAPATPDSSPSKSSTGEAQDAFKSAPRGAGSSGTPAQAGKANDSAEHGSATLDTQETKPSVEDSGGEIEVTEGGKEEVDAAAAAASHPSREDALNSQVSAGRSEESNTTPGDPKAKRAKTSDDGVKDEVKREAETASTSKEGEVVARDAEQGIVASSSKSSEEEVSPLAMTSSSQSVMASSSSSSSSSAAVAQLGAGNDVRLFQVKPRNRDTFDGFQMVPSDQPLPSFSRFFDVLQAAGPWVEETTREHCILMLNKMEVVFALKAHKHLFNYAGSPSGGARCFVCTCFAEAFELDAANPFFVWLANQLKFNPRAYVVRKLSWDTRLDPATKETLRVCENGHITLMFSEKRDIAMHDEDRENCRSM